MSFDLDIKKLCLDNCASMYKADYSLYLEDCLRPKNVTFDTLPVKHTQKQKEVCLSSLWIRLGEFYKSFNKAIPNRFVFNCAFKLNGKSPHHTNEEERAWWVEVCKKHGLMQFHIGKYFLDTGYYVINLTNISQNELYIYFSAARLLQETPAFVKIMYYLCAEKEIDFFLAFAMASKLAIPNSGHHILSFYMGYGGSVRKLDDIQVMLSQVRGLRKFLALSKKEKKGRIKKTWFTKSPTNSFSTRPTIHATLRDLASFFENIDEPLKKLGRDNYIVKFKDLQDKDVLEYIYKD